MLGAIYIGLSGMNAYARGLQTISNNVANMNSIGFKAATVTFSDVFNVGGLGSAYSGHGSRFSGAGVRFGSNGMNFAQGDMRPTGGDLDLAIQGAGFLTLSDQDRTYYARTGQFTVNDEGYIVMQGTDYRLNVFDADRRPSAVNVDLKRISPPAPTTKISLSGSLSNTGTSTSREIKVIDSRGASHAWTVTVVQSTDVIPTWKVTVKNGLGATVGEERELRFVGGQPIGDTMLDFAYTDSNGTALTVNLDCRGVNNLSSGTATPLAHTVDGTAGGTLTSVSVNDKGHIELAYSNGKKEDLGAVVLADFRDPQKLEQIGDGLFRSRGAEPALRESETGGMGALVAGQVEASNVDLSQQFGDLILIQRGFQASSQVVSVSNDMIQQLFGIRGQG